MHGFSVSATVTGSAATVVATGDVDLATADRLRAAALPLVAPGIEVRLDCEGVDFLDSAGLRVLLELDRTARSAGATLILAAPSDPVTRTLELAGVAHVFNVRRVPAP
jgi:anti-anti-sigma factor